ncbi:MAG: glycosyltransferase family 39 protein [Pseudomonadota bacterium]
MASSSNALRAAWAFIALITLWRVAMLWFNRTDLFVDEAQYWAWGQHLDFGYFSKPPLIGWLIRGVTDALGSDAAFIVRLPAPFLHCFTALLVIWAARAFMDDWVAAWAGAIYVAVPLATVGSSLISTDTVLLPFFAWALGLYGRLAEGSSAWRAVLFGVAIGAGMMAKYAMIYFLLGMALVWLAQPAQRLRPRDMLIAFVVGLAVFAPNIWWNIENDGQTVRHVVEDNADVGALKPSFIEGLNFLGSQFVAFGPILLIAVFWPLFRRRVQGAELTLLLFSVPIIFIVTIQAVLSGAFANWAATAYIAAPILAVSVLQFRRGLLVASQALNVVIALLLPLILVFPDVLRDGRGTPVANRYLGLHDVSEIAADLAEAEGLTTISARQRGLLADLFYTLDGRGFNLRAWTDGRGPIGSWYVAEFPIERPLREQVAYLSETPPRCEGVREIGPVDPGYGEWADAGLRLWAVPAGC